MSTTTLIYAVAVAIVIFIAILFREKISASFMGFKIKTDSKQSSNQADIRGNENDVSQKSSKRAGGSTQKNKVDVDGDKNKIGQE